MTLFKITIGSPGSTQQFTGDTQTPLLEILRNNQQAVRKACRNGACGICRCHLQSGTINYHLRQPFALWESEIEAGYILPCIAYLESDIQIDQITLETPKKR